MPKRAPAFDARPKGRRVELHARRSRFPVRGTFRRWWHGRRADVDERGPASLATEDSDGRGACFLADVADRRSDLCRRAATPEDRDVNLEVASGDLSCEDRRACPQLLARISDLSGCCTKGEGGDDATLRQGNQVPAVVEGRDIAALARTALAGPLHYDILGKDPAHGAEVVGFLPVRSNMPAFAGIATHGTVSSPAPGPQAGKELSTFLGFEGFGI